MITTSRGRRVPCLFMRGGTSRGGFFLAEDLPEPGDLRDRVILNIYGSPDARQINGIGGGDALTSKVAVIGRSSRPDADVDYTFGQVSVDAARVFWVGNCGNMSSAVGPFAIHRGLVEATSPETCVRIFNTNTNKVLVARVPVDDKGVVESGDTAIAGVPGTGAPIMLDFGDCSGAVTGRLLPTGSPRDVCRLADGREVPVSVVDASTPFVFVRASDVGMTGTELPAAIDSDAELLDRLEQVRSFAARSIGLVKDGEVARVVSPSIPRVSVVSAPTTYGTTEGGEVGPEEVSVVGRQMSMQRTHKAYAVTGTLCTAVASAVPGTVVNEVSSPGDDGIFRIGHPGGIISARVRVEGEGPELRILEASLVRTARLIMDGYVHVPEEIWAP